MSVTIRSNVSVAILPATATLVLGASQPFSATVTGSTDASVTWYVGDVVGGNAALGTILNSQIDPNHTTYTAPQALPQGGSVTVSAQSNANPFISATVIVTFTIPISVSISPATSTRALGHRQTFTVQVASTPDQGVDVKVNGIAGGDTSSGRICVTGSNPCQQISTTSGGSFDFLAPNGVPSPNPATILLTSHADVSKTASASATILPHIVVSVAPGSVVLPRDARQRFSAHVTGTDNQQVTWYSLLTGTECDIFDACGTITSSGLFLAPATFPVPNLIHVSATSTEDIGQSGEATVTISPGSNIFSLAPSSAYAGITLGFQLRVSGVGFSTSSPGPGSTIEVAGTTRPTSCATAAECTALLTPTDLVAAGNLAVRVLNPDATSSNTVLFAVIAPGAGPDIIPLTPGTPTINGKDITVVDLSTNGASNPGLDIAAIGPYSLATRSCILGGTPVVIVRPGAGFAAADLCLFSPGGLDPSYNFTLGEPDPPDILITNREPVGLGIVHLTMQVSSTAVPGSRTLFVENSSKDKAAATGVLEVR